MAIKNTLQIGDSKLRASNSLISDFNTEDLKQLVKNLADTMRDMRLIGMAAPQIGENLQLFITEPRVTKFRSADQSDELRVYINPKVIDLSDEDIEIYEGCGSVLSADLFGPVIRPKAITIQALDLEGKKFRYTADGILGRVIQHEYDHLIGQLFTDKVSDYTKLLSGANYREFMSKAEDQVKKGIITIKELEYI